MSAAPHDGLIAVVKRDCPTCELTVPVLGDLAQRVGLQVYTQDDPSFPETVPGRIDDTDLDISHRLKIEIVPTLIRIEQGREIDRTFGWDRAEWERVAGIAGLGLDLPDSRPGCGAKNIAPGVIERLYASTKPGLNRAASPSAKTRTNKRRCTSAAGRTGCRLCRRPRSECCACSTAHRASHSR